tara:strand:+ start:6714 stop:7373 length:660 start_codon:yes stop_codon:yes gene_type:complete
MIQAIGYMMLAKWGMDMISTYQQSTHTEAMMRRQARLNRKYGDRKRLLAYQNAANVEEAGEENARNIEWEGGYQLVTERDAGKRRVSDIITASAGGNAVVNYGSPRRIAMAQALVNKFGQDQLRQSISKKSSAMRNAASRDADIMRKTGDLERDYYYSLGGMANNAANNVRAMRPYTMLSGTLDTGSQMAYMDYSSRMKTGGGNPSRGSGMSMFNWMYS